MAAPKNPQFPKKEEGPKQEYEITPALRRAMEAVGIEGVDTQMAWVKGARSAYTYSSKKPGTAEKNVKE